MGLIATEAAYSYGEEWYQSTIEYVREKRKRNIIKQQFNADVPNKVWVSDVTVFNYGDYYYCICAIIDLFSRKVVAYGISKHNSTQLVKSTMKREITVRKPSPGLILHTDNGSNFCSRTFEKYLKENELVHSFSRSGTPCDNAVAESFFSSLKQEELYRRKINSEAELYRIIEKYINFYNSERLHSADHYKSPDECGEEYHKMKIVQNASIFIFQIQIFSRIIAKISK